MIGLSLIQDLRYRIWINLKYRRIGIDKCLYQVFLICFFHAFRFFYALKTQTLSLILSTSAFPCSLRVLLNFLFYFLLSESKLLFRSSLLITSLPKLLLSDSSAPPTQLHQRFLTLTLLIPVTHLLQRRDTLSTTLVLWNFYLSFV